MHSEAVTFTCIHFHSDAYDTVRILTHTIRYRAHHDACVCIQRYNALEAHVDRIMKELDDGMHMLARDATNNVRDDGEPSYKTEHKTEHGSEQKSGAAWGSSASKYGITASTDGKRIAWGAQVVTDFQTAPDTKTHCPGRFAPASSQHLWCGSPNECCAKRRTSVSPSSPKRPAGPPPSAQTAARSTGTT